MSTLPALSIGPRIARWCLALVLPLAIACQSDRLQPPPAQPEDLYWALEIDQGAVTLATTPPYNTLTLKVTPRNSRGEPLSGLPAPTFTSTDPDRVLVTAEGMLVAVASTGSELVKVIATLVTDNLKHADTALVRVVDGAPPWVLGTFSIHPIPPDSAKTAVNDDPLGFGFGSYSLNARVRATDVAAAPITDLLVSFRSSDVRSASIGSHAIPGEAWLKANRTGAITLYANTTAFGITKADTLPFRIGWPLIQFVAIAPVAPGSSVNRFVESATKIGTGGLVVFGTGGITTGFNFTTTATDVTFTDPVNVAPLNTFTAISAPSGDGYPLNGGLTSDILGTLCSFVDFLSGAGSCAMGGNIEVPASNPDFSGFNALSTARVFSAPGIYEYHSTIHQTSGRVIVVDEP